ncbi:MAG: universal stress protein [Nocardioidaceae bacterium]|jgi:nucleotide-binding universal stress UspA family protein|nr:universal stress protein [Nocardioidaceae bacterium]
MSVLVAVPDRPEGIAALAAGAAEAQLLETDLIVVNLGLKPLDTSSLPTEVQVKVIERVGRSDRDPTEAVLDEIRDHDVARLVIGIKRRTPVGKAILGSISQRLLLESPVPVVAVKMREGADS